VPDVDDDGALRSQQARGQDDRAVGEVGAVVADDDEVGHVGDLPAAGDTAPGRSPREPAVRRQVSRRTTARTPCPPGVKRVMSD
jgi:hypothetical protein